MYLNIKKIIEYYSHYKNQDKIYNKSNKIDKQNNADIAI